MSNLINNFSNNKNTTLNITDLLVIFFLLFFCIIQIIVIQYSPLNLAGDEAYYWLWSRKLDLCYYEKGPGIALLIKLGCLIFGDTELGVRSGAMLCQFLISLLLYFFVSKNYQRTIALQCLLIYWSTLLFGSLGLFMTCDPPLCLFWLLSIIAAHSAITKDKAGYWIACFICVAIAALFKYSTLILIPCFIFYLICNKERKHHLYSYKFYLALTLAALILSPVLIWNMQHGWINFNKAAGHIESKKSFLSVKHFFELIGGQLGLIGPVIFPLFIYCLYLGYKEWKQNDQISGLYIFAAIPLAILCLILSFTRSVYANWPMPLYYSTLLLYAHLSHRQKQIKFSPSLISKGIKFNFFLLFIGHLIFTGNDFNIPIQYLPSKKLIVGESLGREVAKKMQENPFTMCNNNSKKPFILSEKYMNASLIAFYSNYPDLVFLADPSMPKLSQFDIWQNWKKQKGDNALLVFSSEEELQDFSPLFKSIQPLGKINTLYHDEVAGEFYFYLACDYSGKNLSNLQ